MLEGCTNKEANLTHLAHPWPSRWQRQHSCMTVMDGEGRWGVEDGKVGPWGRAGERFRCCFG